MVLILGIFHMNQMNGGLVEASIHIRQIHSPIIVSLSHQNDLRSMQGQEYRLGLLVCQGQGIQVGLREMF